MAAGGAGAAALGAGGAGDEAGGAAAAGSMSSSPLWGTCKGTDMEGLPEGDCAGLCGPV